MRASEAVRRAPEQRSGVDCGPRVRERCASHRPGKAADPALRARRQKGGMNAVRASGGLDPGEVARDSRSRRDMRRRKDNDRSLFDPIATRGIGKMRRRRRRHACAGKTDGEGKSSERARDLHQIEDIRGTGQTTADAGQRRGTTTASAT
jgi:hypothetical protein